MRKKTPILPAAAWLAAMPAMAAAATTPADTLRNYDMEEAIVVASPKETMTFRQQPISISIFDRTTLTNMGADDIKDISTFTPNYFMPDYGSRQTSAVYIRGIGSRINTPAVGLYVDNVPVMDKSAYDFAFLDIARVDVLRGPQGTLYGRNSMGGLVRVFTADPFSHTGTDVSLSGSVPNGGRAVRAVTYLHPSSRVAMSVGGFYEGENGFRRNAHSGSKADGSEAAGGKVRLAWRPSSRLRADLTATYEYSDEKACPYYLTKPSSPAYRADSGRIAQNRQSRYRRELATTSAGVEWQTPHFILSSITAWQYLRDRYFIDQDFVHADIFSLTQRQRSNTLSEELVLKSLPGRQWKWTTGAFASVQQMRTLCPVTFHADGMAFLNGMFAAVLPKNPPMSLAFTADEMQLGSRFSTPLVNAALFHQSTFDLGHGLSATAGVRLDYTHTTLRMQSGVDYGSDCTFAMPQFRVNTVLKPQAAVNGHLSDDTWQVLPKVALQYNHRSGRGNVYLAVSKGYRSGGYNIQSYSDLSQSELRRDIMLGVKDYSIATIQAMPGLPQAVKDRAIAGLKKSIDPNTPEAADIERLAYKPEQSWNFEMGGHLYFFNRALRADYTLFCMLTKDQQLAQFARSGMGRRMVNAGRTRSCGGELALRAILFDNRLTLGGNYGFTHAVFTRYDLGDISYKDNHVPFAPSHTMGLSAAWRQPISSKAIHAVTLAANVAGAGKIWWDEANTFSQPFAAQLDARLGVELPGNVDITLWAKNLTDTRMATFSFESMGNRFAQYADPASVGIDLNLHF